MSSFTCSIPQYALRQFRSGTPLFLVHPQPANQSQFPRLGSLFTARFSHFYVCIKVNHIAMLIILIRFIPKQLAPRGHYRIEWIFWSFNLIIYFVMSLSITSLSAGNHSTLSSVSAVSQQADLCSRNSISPDATLHK